MTGPADEKTHTAPPEQIDTAELLDALTTEPPVTDHANGAEHESD